MTRGIVKSLKIGQSAAKSPKGERFNDYRKQLNKMIEISYEVSRVGLWLEKVDEQKFDDIVYSFVKAKVVKYCAFLRSKRPLFKGRGSWNR